MREETRQRHGRGVRAIISFVWTTQLRTHDSLTTNRVVECGPIANRSVQFTMANHPIPAALSPPMIECGRATETDADETDDKEESEIENWITAVTEGKSDCTVPDDYGLFHIAEHLGTSQVTAVTTYWQGAEKEQLGDISGAMKLYQRA
jgi:hypothetical protein